VAPLAGRRALAFREMHHLALCPLPDRAIRPRDTACPNRSVPTFSLSIAARAWPALSGTADRYLDDASVPL